jgi:hypothetical protein
MRIKNEITGEKKFNLSADDIKVLEQESDKHVKGKSKSYTWDEAKQFIRDKKKFEIY